MRAYLKTMNDLIEKTGKAFSYLIYAGTAILFLEVILRYFFNAPTVWVHGYSQRIFGSYFILIGAFTLLRGGHVRIDLFYNRFSLKGRAFLDMVNYAFLIVWGYVLIKEGWLFFMRSYAIRQVDEMILAHPVYPVKFLLVVGAVLIFVQGINLFIIQLMTFVKGEKYEL